MDGGETVTVSMPYYRCPGTLRRAVESVLGQTHRGLRLVVVDDGDAADPAAKVLHGVADPRLTVFELGHNLGRYYADAVTLAACATGWFAVHDADDWCEPVWLTAMLAHARRTGAQAVYGPQVIHRANGTTYIERVTALGRPLGPRMRHLAHHAGLVRTNLLRAAGGYHPGFRVGYDTLAVNLVKMVAGDGGVGAIGSPLYHRVARPGSLTTARATRFGSPLRRASHARLDELYALARTAADPGAAVAATVPPQLRRQVTADAARLREDLR